MKWDQIERKWEEMARRIQPYNSLPSTTRDKPSKDELDGSSANDQAVPADLFASTAAYKTYE